MRGGAGGEAPSRSEYLDFVKGTAIILVELGHCVQWGSGAAFLSSGLFFEDGLFRFIYSFHMPLFMLVSGYVFTGPLGGARSGKPRGSSSGAWLCPAFAGRRSMRRLGSR